jgi:hypothetical protein
VAERQDLKPFRILLPHLQHMETTTTQLNINKESIILISFYNPPGKMIERNLDFLTGIGHKVTLAVDFNGKHVTWRAGQNNAAGQFLLNHYHKDNYIISAPSQLTHFPIEIPQGGNPRLCHRQ